MLKSLFFALAASALAFAAITDPVRVETGQLSGISGKDSGVRVYKGIPFAAAPVGDRRWRAPQPAAKWEGVRTADQFGSSCTQGGAGGRGGDKAKGGAVTGSEDCLYLNIWTAAQSSSDRRPVMVWIHPGGYTSGSGSSQGTDGEVLAKKGVVLVTTNYRLGVFGFFSHPELTSESDRRASGNYAFMDQVAALRWIQENIGAFGGDPTRVTVFGDSAGSSSISNLMASPLAKGLFQRASGQSGAWLGLSVSPMRKLADSEQAGAKMAESLGAKSLAELRAKPAEEILRGGRGGGPVIDGYFLPDDPANIFAQGKQNDVPLIAGSNKDEGTFFLQTVTAEQWVQRSRQKFGGMADAFLKLYPAGSDEEANRSQYAAFRDELAFVMRNWAAVQSKSGKSKAYLYYFTHEPPVNGGRAPTATVTLAREGATHGGEAPYIFQNLLGNRPWNDVDRQVADTMSSYWVNFAISGNPNGKGLPDWPAFDEKKNNGRMILGDKAEYGPALTQAQIDFYQAWYEKRR
ncbi:MAG: carboxylesterase family protein [Bryobacterales bacterium]|nr:carboxylesterase family protein [Bryobacterales bacterium]MBV9400562.1 carboxylesterase family protein [Bryobacterales bacterium]